MLAAFLLALPRPGTILVYLRYPYSSLALLDQPRTLLLTSGDHLECYAVYNNPKQGHLLRLNRKRGIFTQTKTMTNFECVPCTVPAPDILSRTIPASRNGT